MGQINLWQNNSIAGSIKEKIIISRKWKKCLNNLKINWLKWKNQRLINNKEPIIKELKEWKEWRQIFK